MEITLESIVYWALVIGLVLVLIKLFIRPIRFVVKLIVNSILGIALLILLNLFGAGFGVYIGINLFTGLIALILGLPGMVLLLLLKLLYGI